MVVSMAGGAVGAGGTCITNPITMVLPREQSWDKLGRQKVEFEVCFFKEQHETGKSTTL